MATAAGAQVVVVVVVASPPPLEPNPALCRGRLPVPAAAKAAMYLILAGLWVAFASAAAAVVARRAWGNDSPVVAVALLTFVGADLFSVLLLVPFVLWLLCTLRAMGFRFRSQVQGSGNKVPGASIPDMPQQPLDKLLLGVLSLIPFTLLLIAGCLVLVCVKGSQGEKVGFALYDVGLLSIAAIFCFFTIPACALKVGKIKAMQWCMRCNI